MLNRKLLLNFNMMQLLLLAIMVLGYVFNIKTFINWPLITIIILKIISLKGKVIILLRNVLTYIDYKLLVLMFTFSLTLFDSSIFSKDHPILSVGLGQYTKNYQIIYITASKRSKLDARAK